MAAILACISAYLVQRLFRYWWSLLCLIARRRRSMHARRQRRTPVAFYQRLETTLAQLGLQREAAQTQRQFARRAAQHLASSPQHAPVADVPVRIVEAFYRVRFGDWKPDAHQEAEIRDQLQRLEQTLP